MTSNKMTPSSSQNLERSPKVGQGHQNRFFRNKGHILSDINTKNMYTYVFEVADFKTVDKNTIQGQYMPKIQDGAHNMYHFCPKSDLTRVNTNCIQFFLLHFIVFGSFGYLLSNCINIRVLPAEIIDLHMAK